MSTMKESAGITFTLPPYLPLYRLHVAITLKNKLKTETEKQKSSLEEILSTDIHLLFHFHETRHCCMCASKKTTQRNIHLTKQQWDRLFITIPGTCHARRIKRGLCCCKYIVNPSLNVDSLDSDLISKLLLCLFQLPENERRTIQILMKTSEILDFGQGDDDSEMIAMDNSGNSCASFSGVDDQLKKMDDFDFYSENNANQQQMLLLGHVIASQNKILLRLNTVVDKIQRSENMKRYLEDSPRPPGSTSKKQKIPTDEQGGKIGRITPTTAVFSGVKKRQDVHYSYDSFPRFYYKQQLVKHFENRVASLQSTQDEFNILSSTTLTIHVTGDIKSSHLRLLSKRKGLQHPQNKVWSSDVLVCFLDDSLSISIFKELSDLDYKDVIIVRNDSFPFHNGKNPSEFPRLHFVRYEKKCIRETITMCLETRLADCMEKLQKKLENIRPSRRNARSLEKLGLEVSALFSLINEAIKTNDLKSETHEKCETQTSCVPTEIKDFLLKRENVHSFGIWRGGSFKVFVGENENIAELKTELNKRYKLFFEKYELNVEILSKNDMTFGKCPYIGQGDKLFENNEENRYGTLGGIVRNSIRPEQIFAMTCSHVYPKEGKSAFAQLTSGKKPEKIGTCYFSEKTGPTFCDFALIKIDERFQETCATILKDETGKECSGIIFKDRIPGELYVHKKGATTEWTVGLILSPEFYIKEFGGREEVFLVSETAESLPFSKPGDSGSIVFFHDKKKQSLLNVLGMIWAGEPSLKDENEEQGAGISSTVDNIGEKSNSLKDASVCFRIDKALQILSKKKDTIVKFDEALSSSSSNESDGSDD